MTLRLAVLSALLFVASAQTCAFNSIVIFAGTNRFTGLTVGNAFGGGIIDVTASSGNAADCQVSGTIQDGDTCTFNNMAGTAYSNSIVATCNAGVLQYSTTTLIAMDCATPNAGTATISPPHKFGEDGVYTCPATDSCSVDGCTSQCDAGTVNPQVDCNAKCTLGATTGMTVITTAPGTDGSDCTGPLISVAPFSPTCSATADVGYTCTGLPLTGLTCATAAGTLITQTCTENQCTDVDISVGMSPVAGLIGDPTNLDQCGTTVTLSVVSDPSCDVMCDQSAGYQEQRGTFQCTNTAGGVAPDLSITACTPVDCPADSTQMALRNCVCNAGFSGVITYTGTAYSGTCTLIECDAYNFPTNPADIVTGDTDGCNGGDVLSVNDPTCTVKCAPGYNDAADVVTCDYVTTKQSTTPLMCTEKLCASYTFGTGITGGINNGCSNPQVLRQATVGSCTLSCAPGYSGADGTLDCPTSLTNGASAIENIVCTENTCAVYSLQPGEVAVAPGCNNLGTVTGNTCTLTCDTGYTVGSGVVTCPPDALQGDAPTVTSSPNCQRTCALHTCGVGYIPKAIQTTVCDTMNGCTDVDCCDSAACPTYSTTGNTDATLTPPSCECQSGFTGMADWDASATAWVHTCTPHCANPNYGGCDTNVGSLIADPANTLCTGSGSCDAMAGCAACLETDCCVQNTCNAPGTNFPSQEFNGMDGDQCTTVASCQPVGCAVGYRGTPILQCRTNGGDFTFNPACDAADCPPNSSPPGVCNCDGGYRVTGGGTTNWDPTSRSWTHTCELTCAHSSFTDCNNNPGFKLATDPENIVCGATCTAAICCRETCDNANFACPATGYSLRADPAQIECPTTGCDQATCCLAMCDNTGFTGCQASGFTPAPNQASTACGDNTITSCTTDLCCLSTTCSNVVCAAGSNEISPVPNCAICNQGNCCQENVCQALTAGQFPEYLVAGGTTCTSVTGCNPVACAPGYHADPVAQLLCLADGGLFTATGCVENVCTSGTVDNYITTTTPCDSVTQCGAVTCGPGYNDRMGTPTIMCNTHGGALTATGCYENVCQAPGPDGIVSITFTGPDTCTTATECGVVSCSRGYDSLGTPSMACLNEGDPFTPSGCLSKQCNPPLSNQVDGYSVTTPTCVRTEQCGAVSCNIGFYEVSRPTIVCPVANGEFEYSGCDPVPCPNNATGTLCECDNGFTGTPNWDAASNSWTHVCVQEDCPANAGANRNCACNDGYTGTPTWSGTAWTHVCTIAACPANAINPPSCTCDTGFRGTPTWDLNTGTWTHTCTVGQQCPANSVADINGNCICNNGYIMIGSVCTGVNCPAGASPIGICTCSSGSPAPAWSSVSNSWTHVCSTTGCPTNSQLVGSTCVCNNGYRMINNVCSAVTCPTGASPVGICQCPNNNPLPVWSTVTLSWTHTCSTVSCTTNASPVNGVCVCNNGYRMDTATGLCNAVTCPAGASPVGICQCPNNSPAASWNSVTQSWNHVCTSSCPANSALISGNCVCNNGYRSSGNVCVGVVCPTGAAPIGVCTCTNGGATPVWNSVTRTWTHTCSVVTNTPPTGVIPTANLQVNVASNTNTVSIPSFMTGVTPGIETTQTVTSVCTPQNPSLFASGPTLVWDRTTSTAQLQFTRATSAAATTTVTCVLTDNFNPPASTAVGPFTVNFLSGTVGSVPCGSIVNTVAGLCTFQSPLSVLINTVYSAPFLTNLPTTTSTTTSCTADRPELFTSQPTISQSGQLDFTSAGTVGSSTVRCTTQNIGSTAGSTYDFVINIGGSNNWMRARVARSLDTFSAISFIRALLDILRGLTFVRGISIKYACPTTACPTASSVITATLSDFQCPATHSLRLAAGCRNEFAARDIISILQGTSDIIVDFDIDSDQLDGTSEKISQRDQAMSTINSNVLTCSTTGSSCTFADNNVPLVTGTNVALTPEVAGAPAPVASSSDDDIPEWVWILVALGCLLCCCLLIALYCCMKKKKKNKGEEQYNRDHPPPVVNRQDPSYYDSYRSGSSYDATSYSSSYIPETFIPGERVRAQYIDGQEYDGEIFAQAADGTYNIKWYDGSHSEGVPARQITKL